MTAEHLAEVERKIADLTRLAEELRNISASCRGGWYDLELPYSRCHIPDCLMHFV